MMLKPLILVSVINSSQQQMLTARDDLLAICRRLAQQPGSAALVLLLILPFNVLAKGPYQTTEAFLQETFSGTPPSPGVVWLRGEVKETTAEILGHAYPGIRVRYWGVDNRTAWGSGGDRQNTAYYGGSRCQRQRPGIHPRTGLS